MHALHIVLDVGEGVVDVVVDHIIGGGLVLLLDHVLLRDVVEDLLRMDCLLLDFLGVFKTLDLAIFIPGPLFRDLEDRLGNIVLIDGLAHDAALIGIDVVVLGAATVLLQWLEVDAMNLLVVLH